MHENTVIFTKELCGSDKIDNKVDRIIPVVHFPRKFEYQVHRNYLKNKSSHLAVKSNFVYIYPIHNKNDASLINLKNVTSKVDNYIKQNINNASNEQIHVIVGDTNVKRKIQDNYVTTDNKWYDAMLDDDGDVTMDGYDNRKIDRGMYRVSDKHFNAVAYIESPSKEWDKIDDSIELNVEYNNERTSNNKKSDHPPISDHPFCIYTLRT